MRELRQIPVDLLDGRQLPDGAPVRPLFDSVLQWGVLQPLLVAASGAGYRVIAGHRRLAAAHAAGLATVPCIVIDVADSDISAVADASNVAVKAVSSTPVVPPPGSAIPVEVIKDLQECGVSVRSSLSAATGSGLRRRILGQLVEIELHRQSWLLDAMALVAGLPPSPHRHVGVGGLLRAVAAAFQGECELGAIDARLVMDAGDLVVAASEAHLRAALGCAIGGMLTLMHAAEDPRAELVISARDAGSHVVFSIGQNVVPARACVSGRPAGSRRDVGRACPSATFAFDAVRRAAELNGWRVDVRPRTGEDRGCDFEVAVQVTAGR